MRFSSKDRFILKKLAKKLPMFPRPALDKETICAIAGEDWETILGVMVKVRRAAELRQPGLPLIKCASERYQLVGSTDKKGRLRLFQAGYG